MNAIPEQDTVVGSAAATMTDDTPAPPGGWKNPGIGFMAPLAFAVVAVNGGLLAAMILTMSLKAAIVGGDQATTVFSIAELFASIFALVGYPVIGRLSDRTLSRFGRRRPYLVIGAVLILLGGFAILAATSAFVLTVGISLLMLGSVTSLVACLAVVPDQVEPAKRGMPSAMIGLGTPVGALVGLFLAQLVAPNLALMIMVPTGLSALASLVFAAVLKDRQLDPAERPAFRAKDLLGTFWVNPFVKTSFGLAWISRLLLFLGVAAVNAFQAFYLIMAQHVSPAEVAGKIFQATLVLTVMSLVFAPIAGKISDKVGARKPFVIASAIVFAIGLALVAQATTFTGFLFAIAVMGLGQGVYFAVDFALVTQVLPDQTNPAKDLGIMNLASNLPASIVPAIAPLLLAIGATATMPQNFTSLFMFGAVAALIGGLVIIPIRGVK